MVKIKNNFIIIFKTVIKNYRIYSKERKNNMPTVKEFVIQHPFKI